ncbi:hypothetical protein ACWDDN_31675 [Streptomyces griseoruber]
MTLMTRRSLLIAGTATAGALLVPVGSAQAAPVTSGRQLTVGSGETYEVAATTRLKRLTVADGGTLTAPGGYGLTLTVDGVETGQKLTATGGMATVVRPGTYRGDVVLTVAAANDITYETLTFPFRQALYVDAGGVVRERSVPAAVQGGKLTGTLARDVSITSTGECFDGLFVQDGTYTLQRPVISLTRNGRCDFAGYGAAVVGDGSATTLVVEGARISTKGVVRTAVISNDGAGTAGPPTSAPRSSRRPGAPCRWRATAG